jgi:uncharacterized protein with NRDE domain
MCIIGIAFRVHPRYPLLVAANRDEYYARASAAVEVLLDSPRTIGGRDLTKGGTWMGATGAGLFVGLTNRRTVGPPEPALRSRGEIVLAALQAGTVAGAVRYLEGLDAQEYNAFNVVFGDANALRVAYGRAGESRVDIHPLGPGLHVLDNDSMGTPMPKVARMEQLLAPLVGDAPWPDLARRIHGEVLRDHALPPPERVPPHPAWMDDAIARSLQALCVHTPAYGTRSSTIVAMEQDAAGGRGIHYAFSSGPPCETPLEDVSRLLVD